MAVIAGLYAIGSRLRLPVACTLHQEIVALNKSAAKRLRSTPAYANYSECEDLLVLSSLSMLAKSGVAAGLSVSVDVCAIDEEASSPP